jgi:putative Mg2+ transporter-C (MgtC) family protein
MADTLQLYLFWCGHLVAAILLALPTAWNREASSQTVGLRTFPLVALGACAYVLIGHSVAAGSPDAMARLLQGLMTGVGFVGGGAILKHDDYVAGTASAASIWIMGALGAAIGFGYWPLAVLLSLLNFLLIYVLGKLKPVVNGHDPGGDDHDENVDDQDRRRHALLKRERERNG